MRAFLIFAASVLLMSSNLVLAQGGPSSVGVQEVEMRALTETVPVFADVVTARDGTIASRVAGNVEKVHVLAGAQVDKDDLLVELNQELLTILVSQSKAELEEAAARIETAQARLDRAETVFARTEGLRGSTSFSEGRFDEVQADVLEARSELVAAKARETISQTRLDESRYRLRRSEIRAPFAGVVIAVQTIPGAFIQAGTPVLRMIDTESFEIEARIPGQYVGALAAGQEVQAVTSSGTNLTARVRAILPIEDPATRTRAVRFVAPDLGNVADVAAGASLTLQIPIGGAREVLSVPKDALVQSANGWTVFVVEDDMAQPRTVQLGVAVGDRYEVLSGLAPGDLAVIRGNERLRPGQPVAASPMDAD
ncbi:efflux RND transporter periplasmic adaptor subunit [Sulfitobacter sp. JB4-11]|uniref:efflux RND transporter periplasmic adaptor subunit n=1 Tax=Sulfitobacter rhodophyticola TaxID=3238304 RepID=UPI0035172BB9